MTPLVFLPGMMCDARLWGPQVAAMSHLTLHFPTLSGQDSMAALAAQVLAQAPPRFALAGLSMGGIVAMEVIRQAPDRVARLALLDTNPRAESPQMQVRRGPQIDRVRRGGLTEVMRDEMKPNYLSDGRHKREILDLCMEMAVSLGPEAFISQSVALRDRPDQQQTLKAVTVPTLILCGRDDALCPVERHQLMHGLIPGSTLHIVDGAGHLPTLEQPQHTTTALLRWMEE